MAMIGSESSWEKEKTHYEVDTNDWMRLVGKDL